MSDFKMVSPLLDHMAIEAEVSGHAGCRCYQLRAISGGERYILKVLSVPASENQVSALILSGAYSDEAAVHEYYGGVAETIRQELKAGQKLSETGSFVGAKDFQIEPKESGVGYHVYILYPLHAPLSDYMADNTLTHLRAVNLGLDLCDALSACRQAGYIFENVKPENVFLMPSGRFMLGDLGLCSTQDLEYSSVPESYIGAFSAPELSDITASPNLTIDLYSLGMVLYRVYNGNHGPFEDEATGEQMADKLRLTGKPLPAPMFADYELSAIILKACAPKPADRFQTPEELKQALTLYMQRNEVSDQPIAPPIVTDTLPIVPDDAEETLEDEPIRMTKAEALDDDFRRSFAPDTSGAGSDAVAEAPAAPQAEQTPNAPSAPPQKAPAEEKDPDQLDFDEFLASVAEVVGRETAEPAQEEAPEEPQPEPEEAPNAYVDTAPEEEKPPRRRPPQRQRKQPKSKAARFVPVAIIAVLILAIIAVSYFVISRYFVEVESLNVPADRKTPDSFTVELIGDAPASSFILTCNDHYGNSYPASSVDGNLYTFTGLAENMEYQINVRAAARHKLTSASITQATVKTAEITHITDFTVTAGQTDGQADVSFRHEGPAPKQWLVSYTSSDGSVSGTQQLDKTEGTISGLALNKTYTFRLEDTEDVFLDGNLEDSATRGSTVAVAEIVPRIAASDLKIARIEGAQIQLAWSCGTNVPEQWEVTCEAAGLEPIHETTKTTALSMTLPDLNRDYTFTVSAKGILEPATLTLPASPIVVTSFTAHVDENGSVIVNWALEDSAPVGGWLVSYGVKGSEHDPRLQQCGTNSTELTGLIPATDYVIELLAADGSAVFGPTQAEVRTADAKRFTGYGVSGPYISLWVEPSDENWDYRDLRNTTTTFSADQSLALCVEVNSVYASNEEVELLYIVRNSDGVPVEEASKTIAWNNIWYSRRHASVFPNPGVSGDYTLEIYINGQLLIEKDFKIS